MRWLLLDEVLSINRGRYCRTKSRILDAPVSSEILLIEMMAQTAGLLLGAESDFNDDLVFTKIENAEFHQLYAQGDEIIIEATSNQLKSEGAWFDAQVRCGNRRIASARFLLMNVGRLVQDSPSSITFHDAFMNYFSVRQKVKQTG